MAPRRTTTEHPLAAIEQATEASRAELADFWADVRDGFGHIVERLDVIAERLERLDAIAEGIARLVKLAEARERRENPPKPPY